MSSRTSWWLIVIRPGCNSGIQGGSIHTLIQLAIHIQHSAKNLIDIITCKCGQTHNRGERKNRELEPYAIHNSLKLVLHARKQVDLIKHDDDSTSTSHYKLSNLLVLISKSFLDINHQENDITLVNCLDGTIDGIVFDIFINLALSPDSSCVNDCEIGILE